MPIRFFRHSISNTASKITADRIVLLPFDELLLAPPAASISTAVAGGIDDVKVNNDIKASLLFCQKINRDFDLGALRAVFPIGSPPL